MASIKSILIRPERRANPIRISEAKINSTGIEGDHYAKPDGSRQVTIIAEDLLAEMTGIIGFQGDAHMACRRNILVESLPKENLTGKYIAFGEDVILEITGYCTPCSRMEENFGKGAIDAFSQRAGWAARVISEGSISTGDLVKFL
ncbi:MAG: MOSC domain-containing protein [Saprospiraceae bacterium]|uniref:MOSC domain-containing protein n=1 Tax=Candidatus Opimibacter skivensis TaxID=2982028 RepID=A0A9D7SZ40_9BACT|nr:MOSC domain-containing protein [Candidatus Opimibacter skivensis]